MNELNSQPAAPNAAETPETVTSESCIPHFDDTREKLEADVRGWCESSNAVFPASRLRQFCKWLDRQAAITEQNCRIEYEDMRDYLQDRVDELTAERDELVQKMHELQTELETQMDITEELNGEKIRLYDRAKELQAELTTLECACETLRYELADRDRFERDGMRLPIGADGIPIHVGDTISDGMHRKAKCIGVSERDVFFKEGGHVKCNRASGWRVCYLNADGEPITKGDFVYGADGRKWLVTGFSHGERYPIRVEDEKGRTREMKASWCRHEKPRTVEDVLKEVMSETRLAVNPNHLIVEKYADELRKMMGD